MLTGCSRADAAALIADGAVLLGGHPVTVRSRKVAEGDWLDVALPAVPPGPCGDADVVVAVVHADEAVIVVDKPAGLVVHPGAGNRDHTLVQGLLARFPDLAVADWPDPGRPGIVHRLDKGTSGLLVVARTPAALSNLAAQLAARTMARRYTALVWGTVENLSGVIDAPIGRSPSDPTRMSVRADGRRAVTRYEVVRRWSSPQPLTLVHCTLETGRTHQIRVHLAAIGHPVVSDERYRVRGVVVDPELVVGRPFLHAAVLGFDHPTDGRRVTFEAPLPADLTGVLARLG